MATQKPGHSREPLASDALLVDCVGGAAFVFLRAAAGPGVDRHPGLDAQRRYRSARGRPPDAGPGALELQVRLVAAHGPLSPAVPGRDARLGAHRAGLPPGHDAAPAGPERASGVGRPRHRGRLPHRSGRGLSGHCHRRLHGERPARGRAGRGRGRQNGDLPRGHAAVGEDGHLPLRADGLERGAGAPGAPLPPHDARDVAGAGAGAAASARDHAAPGGLVPVPGLPVAPPLAGDPGLRRLLQADRQPGRGSALALPRGHGLHEGRARRDAGPGRDPGHGGRHLHGRSAHHRPGTRAFAVGLRPRADPLQRRLRGAVHLRPPPRPHVLGHVLRDVHAGTGDGRLRRAPPASDAEAVLGHAVRPVLQHVRHSAHRLRPHRGVHRGGHRLDATSSG